LKKAPTDDTMHMRKFDWDDDVPVHGGLHHASAHGSAPLQAEAIALNTAFVTVEKNTAEEDVIFDRFDCVAFKNGYKTNKSTAKDEPEIETFRGPMSNDPSFVVAVGSKLQLPAGWKVQPLEQSDLANAGFKPEAPAVSRCFPFPVTFSDMNSFVRAISRSRKLVCFFVCDGCAMFVDSFCMLNAHVYRKPPQAAKTGTTPALRLVHFCTCLRQKRHMCSIVPINISDMA
jgi:hypothetical protein